MAELHRVEINEKAPSEIEPTEESKTDEVVETTEEQTPTEERPEWLPEKFSSAEEMAKSYSELEKKIGARADNKPRMKNNHNKLKRTTKIILKRTLIIMKLLWKLVRSSFK